MTSMGFGLAVAAPVGPMSILCIRRSLTIGWRQGVATNFGIAAGDVLYAAVAALGLTGISTFMLAYDRPLHRRRAVPPLSGAQDFLAEECGQRRRTRSGLDFARLLGLAAADSHQPT